MSDKLNRKSLTKEDQKELARILDLEPSSLKDYELRHLKARRGYMTRAEKEEFGIKSDKEVKKELEAKAKADEKAKKEEEARIKKNQKEAAIKEAKAKKEAEKKAKGK